MFKSLGIAWLHRCDRWHYDFVYFLDGSMMQHFDRTYPGAWDAADYHYNNR